MSFRKFVLKWFGYTRSERTGSMVLLFILIVVLIIRTVKNGEEITVIQTGKETIKTENSDLMVRIFNRQLNFNACHREDTFFHLNNNYGSTGSYELFSDERYRLSMDSETVISGEGHSPADNLATVSSGEYCAGSRKSEIPPFISNQIEINTADSAILESLPGIGPVLSVRIIKYRDLLGNFYCLEQLHEVYGLDNRVIDMNLRRLKCDSSLTRKISINSTEYTELLRHPYIKRSQVDAIFSYRRLTGPVRTASDLTLNRIFSREEMQRLRHYISYR